MVLCMGLFQPTDLERLLDSGCSACGGKRFSFQSYVDAKQGLMEGEPVTKLAWAYNGEGFCDGIFEIQCASCNATAFRSEVCPRCNAEGGLAVALESENRFVVPLECPRCETQEVTYFSMVPAITTYESRRAEKAKTETALLDPGFHGTKAACKTCGPFAEQRERCPLCDSPGPIRPRPS